MKAKIRRQIAALLKELKVPSKLYRGSKLAFYRGSSGGYMRLLAERLLLSMPRTVVHDCDGFNHVVKELAVYTYIRNGKRTPNDSVGLTSFQNEAWRRRGYVFVFPQVNFEDGNCSCGCESTPEPAWPRDLVERQALGWYRNPHPGWPLTEAQIRRRDALLQGEHITNEQGVLLENFRERE